MEQNSYWDYFGKNDTEFGMKKRYLASLLLGSIAFCWILLSSRQIHLIIPLNAQSTNLTVSAAVSLKDALTNIQSLYQKSQANIKLTYNFGSSGSLQQQIEQGAPVDIFLSAASKQMDALAAKNLLLPGSRSNLLTNQLVLVASPSQKAIAKISDLARPDIEKIAIGEPKSVPAGQYAEQTLRYYKLFDRLKSKLVFAKDVRQVLTYVETGNISTGFVYQTDANTLKKVRVAATAPSPSHQPIVYPIAILKDSKNKAAARSFLQFLKSKPAQAAFKKYGFGV